MSTHTEHVTVTDARLYDCLEGECDHVDEDGQPEDMSACPVLTVEVCVDCMAEHERGRSPEDWDDLALAEWPCAAAEPDGSRAECTCPSGDGSLRWPCPTHPPTNREPDDYSGPHEAAPVKSAD